MNEYRFTAEVARHARDVGAAKELWRSAMTCLAQRTYTAPSGIVRVQADWTPLTSNDEIVQIDVRAIDDSGQLTPRDVPSFVELFFHDVFLLLNIAVPGSFGGAITITGAEYRVSDLSFDASSFLAGSTSVLPLGDVVAWYHGGIEQIAETPMQKVLFHLLHVACDGADEWMLRARLDQCLKALGMSDPSLDINAAGVMHPMHDEGLDDRVDDSAAESLDQAMARMLTAIQEAVRAQ